MKKLILMCALGVMVIGLMAAAPAINNWAANLGATFVVDSQSTSTQWELLDSIIVIKTDTCYTEYTMKGTAILGSYDKLYLGFDDGGGAGGAPLDTFIIVGDNSQRSEMQVSFAVSYLDSLISQTDANDTIYFYAAVGGSSSQEKVTLLNTILTAEVHDFNAAGVIGE